MHSYLGSTGIRLDGVCDRCSGDGRLATTERAAYAPERYPEEMIVCPNCGGKGGDTEEAGARGRRMSELYAQALGLKDPPE